MKKILITGFEPFGGELINVSWEAVKCLKAPKDIILEKILIPTVFNESFRVLIEEIKKFKPDAVLCVGQAAGRKVITPERVAININDARIPDNSGNMPIDEKIEKNGENAYFSTLPNKKIVKKLTEAGIPASISDSAGTFVCNNLMYGLLHFINEKMPDVNGGFIHIPCIPEQLKGLPEATPTLPLEKIIKGLELSIEVIAENY